MRAKHAAAIAVLMMALAAAVVAPAAMATAPRAAAGSACTSMAGVKGFKGRASIGFNAQAHGQDVGNGGTYSASLSRDLSGIAIRLTTKTVTRPGVILFTGTAGGGDVTVNDSFVDTGANAAGKEEHNGPLTHQLPTYGSAVLFVFPVPCRYQLEVAFGIQTTFTGNVPGADPHPSITGSVYTAEDPISKSLTLSDDLDADVYWGGGCPRDGMQRGLLACYMFGGGEVGLCGTSDLVAADCSGPSDQRLSDSTATFSWHLTPTLVHPKGTK